MLSKFLVVYVSQTLQHLKYFHFCLELVLNYFFLGISGIQQPPSSILRVAFSFVSQTLGIWH